MTIFVLVFTEDGAPEFEEEQAKVLENWGAWYAELGDAAADPGIPISPVVLNIVSDGTVSIIPISTQSSGYTILKSGSIDTAYGMVKKCPMLAGNSQITLYETLDM